MYKKEGGKVYIELSKLKILMILIFLLLVVMFSYFLYYVQDNIESLQRNPLSYGVNLYGFEGCSCKDYKGSIWTVNGSDVWQIITPAFNPDYSFTNFTIYEPR
jgi:hypothetical protein